MKRLTLLAIAGLMAAAWASPSLAADLPRPAYKAPVYVAPTAFSWTGFYVGLNGGYAWGHSDWNHAVGGNVSYNVKKYQVGGTFGYNMQTGNFVFGLEGDVDASWADGSGTGGGAGTPCSGNGCQTKNTWLATGRGRIGYAWDRFLPYITGGAAIGNIKATSQNGGSVDKTSSAGSPAPASNGRSCRTGRRSSNTSTPISATSPATRQPAAAVRTPRSPTRPTWSASA